MISNEQCGVISSLNYLVKLDYGLLYLTKLNFSHLSVPILQPSGYSQITRIYIDRRDARSRYCARGDNKERT